MIDELWSLPDVWRKMPSEHHARVFLEGLIRPTGRVCPHCEGVRSTGLHGDSVRAGFSLLEVLIAFAVMAAVLGALLPGQAAMAARTGEAMERLPAADTALSRAGALT